MCNAIRFGVVAWIVAVAASANGQDVTRVNVSSNGDEATDLSGDVAMSSDGRYVAFSSYASNLVAGDTNSENDVFVHDRVTGQTTRVSVASAGNEADGYSTGAAVSADGRFVAFFSEATNLVPGDTNGHSDAFVHDTLTGTTSRVSVDSSGIEGNGQSTFALSMSADGQLVAFESWSTNLVAGDSATAVGPRVLEGDDR